MAQRLIYDGNWPQTGGNSGATAVNGETGSPNESSNCGLDTKRSNRTTSNSRDPAMSVKHEERQVSGSGGNRQYGQVRLYWWQGVGVLNDN